MILLFAYRLISYFRIAVRRIARNPWLTLVNVGGLAVAMTCTMLIVSIRYELSFDRQHEHYDRIFRLDWRQPRSVQGRAVDLDPMKELHEVVAAVPLRSLRPILVRDRQRFRQFITFAPPSVFDVFTIALQRGTPSVLDEPFR
ncbi:MAG: ABC transporter permease [Candidatus Latescibacterota bacterium]